MRLLTASPVWQPNCITFGICICMLGPCTMIQVFQVVVPKRAAALRDPSPQACLYSQVSTVRSMTIWMGNHPSRIFLHETIHYGIANDP